MGISFPITPVRGQKHYFRNMIILTYNNSSDGNETVFLTSVESLRKHDGKGNGNLAKQKLS